MTDGDVNAEEAEDQGQFEDGEEEEDLFAPAHDEESNEPAPPVKEESSSEEPPVKEESSSETSIKVETTEEPSPLAKPSPQLSPIPRKKTNNSTKEAVKSDPRLLTTKPPSSPGDPRATIAPSAFNLERSRPGVPGTTMGLPEGVMIPVSIDATLLAGKLLDTLQQLPIELINDALVEYDDALQNKGGSIRNQGAYLYGVIKRYVHVHERAANGDADEVMGQELTPVVQTRLEKLVADGFCTQEEMNDKVKSKIRMLSEKDALFAIDELSSVERGQIRNFSSYFMGILNRYMRGDKGSKRTDVASRTSSSARPNDMYGKSERKYDDRFRGRSPDRDYRRRDSDDHYRPRERSRDRLEDDRRRDDYRRNEPSNSYRPRFEETFRSSQPSTHQLPPQQQHQSQQQFLQGQFGGYGSVPPPPPPRQGMAPVSAYAPQQQIYMQPPNQIFQQQPQQFVPQPQQVNPLGAIPGSSFVPQHQTMGSQLQMGQQPAFLANMQQQQQQPLMGSQQPTGIPNVSYGALAPGTLMQPTVSTNTAPAPSIPADILGLADKAASAVKALQATHSFSAPLGVPNAIPQTQPQFAAPAVGPPQMTIPPGHQFSSYSSQPPSTRRIRTTASMYELSQMIQLSIQNLRATGHIDGELDRGMLGMIKDLPEPQALEALGRFSSIDTSQMRNKTAYLAGVLRRELEKIQRR